MSSSEVSAIYVYTTDTGEALGWLQAYDLDAHDGRGDVTFTDDPAHAMRFANFNEAHTAWSAQSTKRPLRGDGQPNRPLTAFTARILAHHAVLWPAPAAETGSRP